MAVRVTIFDDNKRLLDSLSVLIDGSPGFQMAGIFENCNNLISDIERTQPDVILMDIVMPETNGFQATRKITKDPDTAHIPVIIVSTKSQTTDRMWGMRQGASEYLTKPVVEAELIAAVNKVLSK